MQAAPIFGAAQALPLVRTPRGWRYGYQNSSYQRLFGFDFNFKKASAQQKTVVDSYQKQLFLL
ncbi:hypothetical protein COAQ111491_12775 [Comamonas aquatilis]|uniref:hypothetical protein n=1 Tax=Comamonas aquatilis TaxID=1778406 RepID=UPI0039F0C992